MYVMCCVPSVFQWQPADSFQLVKQPADGTGGLDPFPFPAFLSTELVRSIFPRVALPSSLQSQQCGCRVDMGGHALVHVFSRSHSVSPFLGVQCVNSGWATLPLLAHTVLWDQSDSNTLGHLCYVPR